MRWPDGWGGSVRREIALGRLTTFRLGGAAAYAFFPRDKRDLGATLRFCRDLALPIRVLGDGSNVLVSSRRFSGAVVCTRGLQGIRESNAGVVVAAGTSLPRVIGWSLREDRIGLETLVGIPGSVGGAVRMNAGGAYGTIGARVVRIRGLDILTSRPVERDAAACGFGYRTSALDGIVVTEVVLDLPPGDGAAGRDRAREIMAEKRSRQPLKERTAGCVFKNPPGESAGRLIDEAGCKGLRQGGAYVSPLHANFIIAGSGARAEDVGGLIDEVRRRVSRDRGVDLELEIEVWK